MKIIELTPQFVNELPYKPKEGVLYISMLHTITLHLCPCGCGNIREFGIRNRSKKLVISPIFYIFISEKQQVIKYINDDYQ